MNPAKLIFILVRPSESGNIGAVCRAMKNMGFYRLRIVAPEVPIEKEVVQARAVHATDVWERAEHFNSLEDAIADCPLVIGTTRRRGKNRKSISLSPEKLVEAINKHPGPVALLFGNERTGLEKHELKCCHLASHIPVEESFPSLNLSHAVQIYAYELHRGQSSEIPGQWIPIDTLRLNDTVEVMAQTLSSIGFYKQAGREEQKRFFRDILARAGLTIWEARYLESIFRKISRLVMKR